MDKNRLLLVVLIGFAAIIGLGVFLWVSTRDQTADDGTKISNYSQVVKNVPRDMQANIERSLYGIIKKNNESIDPNTVKDAVIRKDSERQERHRPGQISGSFIVDIPSLQQSYKLTYKHSDQNDGFDSGRPLIPLCIEDSERIYPAFDCKNTSNAQEPTDPLLQKLPYKSNFYSIDTYGDKIIIIKIALNYSIDTEKFFKDHAASAKSWLTEQGFALDEYTLEYRDIRNNILNVAL